MKEHQSILDLNNIEAKKHFLKMESYFNSDLPAYFDFNTLLDKIAYELGENSINGIMRSDKKVFECDEVNYTLLLNKDGKLSWRPLQLIHPVLYVNLVNIITKRKIGKK